MAADVADSLARVAGLPGVADAVDAAREACTALRWHQALRRRTAEAGAESRIRAARASAALEGARLPVALFRDAARGAGTLPDDASGHVARGALRAVAETETLPAGWQGASGQVLARLHQAAAAGLVPDDDLGRPRRPGEEPRDGADLREAGVEAPQGQALHARLLSLAALLDAPPSAPALLVAALVHAEVLTARPFAVGNGVVGRALARAVVVTRGLDPFGVAVWEAAHLAAGSAYPGALAAYARGTADGVATWVTHAAQAVVDGAGEGKAVCDSVLAGRTTA